MEEFDDDWVCKDKGCYYPEPVTTWDDILTNIKEFNQNLNSESMAYLRFAQFSHWYYVPYLGMFGPSKFIGYRNMTHERYLGEGSGGITQNALRHFFAPVDHGSAEYRDILGNLQDFARFHGRKISAKTIKGQHGGLYIPFIDW